MENNIFFPLTSKFIFFFGYIKTPDVPSESTGYPFAKQPVAIAAAGLSPVPVSTFTSCLK